MGLNFTMEDYYYGKVDNIEILKEKIWSSEYKLKKKYSFIEFEPLIEELGDSKELFDIFQKYSKIKMVNVKSSYKDKNMTPYDFIKIHLNNTYAYTCVKDCYLSKEYYKKLYYAKNMYFETKENIDKNGIDFINVESIIKNIEDNYKESDRIKLFSNNKKMDLNFNQFKEIANDYIDKIALNFKPIDLYEEDEYGDNFDFETGFSDDNYAVSYINKSITGYFRNKYKKNMGVTTDGKVNLSECTNCGKYYIKKSNRSKYCAKCSKEIKLQNDREIQRKRYNSRI